MTYLFLITLIFSSLILILFILLVIFEFIASLTTEVPFISVPKDNIDTIIRTLHLNNDNILYDLGCGDGRVLIVAARKNPSIQAIGVEKSMLPYLLAKFYTRKYKNIKIKREDIYKTDISNATHIFVYLYPEVMEKLLPIIEKLCRPETRLVSLDFGDKNRKPEEIIDLNPLAKRGKKLIVYKV